MSSSIRINAGMGTELYSYPLGDTTDWNTFNSSNLSNWLPIYNSDTNWFKSVHSIKILHLCLIWVGECIV